MTARAMLLREIQRYYVDRENVTPSHYGMGMDSRGEYVLYADHEAERNRLLDEIVTLKSKLKEAIGDAAILAHAYSTDNRPPTNVVVRSIERGKRALENKP